MQPPVQPTQELNRASALPSGEPALLAFRNVTVMRGTREVLRDLTLRIESGEHVAIIGPNGCGKSSLIKTIHRELYPLVNPASEFRLLGRSMWNIFELRSILGVVSGDLGMRLRREITGRELVLSSFFGSYELSGHEDVTAEMQQRADEAISNVEATHLRERWADELSTGEARRLLIARALVHGPYSLLLDEPFEGLDLRAQAELRATLSGLAQQGIGILLVTHHLPDVIPEIDRVILMQEGRIRHDGPKSELLSSERMTEMFEFPVFVFERDGLYHAH